MVFFFSLPLCLAVPQQNESNEQELTDERVSAV